MANAITGRHGMQMLKQALGLPDVGCRYIKVEAKYNSCVFVEMGLFAKDGAQVEAIDITNADEAGEVRRYMVTVERMPDA